MEKLREGAQVQEAKEFLGSRSSGNMRPFIGKDGKSYIITHKGGDRNDITNYEQVLVTNAVLRYDEWRTLDEAVVEVAKQRLVGFGDLRDNGLVRPLGNAMATTVLTWEEMSDAMEATVAIDPVVRGKGDQPYFQTAHITIPVTFTYLHIMERLFHVAINRGTGLDTINAELAARKVAEKLEDMLFGSSATMTYGGGTIHSYVSHPDVNDITLSENWDASGKTAAEILADVIAMKQALIDDRYYGPYILYIPTSYETVMDEDYSISGASMKTTRQRIVDIESIQKVVVVDRLPDDNVLLVTMQKDVVDLVDGLPFQNIQWDSEGGMIHHYKVMTIQLPRIKSDYDNRSGIALLKA